MTSGGTTLFVRDGALTMLALAEGACVCFDRAAEGRPACAIQRTFGHEALPSACAHFPRVAVTDDRATTVTLSHFCPTAAAMLFRDMQLSIVEAPPSFNSVREYEGLDACGVLPPLLRPGMLMDLESHHAWERHIVRVLDDDVHTPQSALAQLADDAERVRSWRPGDGELMDRIAGLGVSSCAEGSRGPAEAGHYTGSCPQAAHGPAEAGHYAASHTQPPHGPAEAEHHAGSHAQPPHGPAEAEPHTRACTPSLHGPAEAGHYARLHTQATHGRAEAGHHARLHTPALHGPAEDGHCTGSGTPRQLDSGWARVQPGFWLDALARTCVAPALGIEPQPDGLDEIDEELVHHAWLAFGRPIKRYLAAKAFGSWIPWHGGGIRTTVVALAAAQSVLRVEAARQCAKGGRVLDRPLLIEAIRQSDLLLVHKVSSRMLAERLARVESKP